MAATRQEEKKPRIDPRIRERRNKVARSKGRKRLYAILAVFLLVGGYFAARAVLRTSLFSVKKFEILGSQHYSGATLISKSGVPIGYPLTEVNPSVVARRLQKLPWDAAVTVKKKWPNTLQITVGNRTGLAVIPRSSKMSLLVDPTGRVLASQPDSAGKWISLCLIPQISSSKILASGTGCEDQNTVAGGTVPSSYSPLLQLAAAIHADPVAKFTLLALQSSGELDGELSNGLAVRFGTLAQMSEKFRALQLILTQASTTGYSTIDLRVPKEPVLSHW